MSKHNLVVNAIDTATTEGRWKRFVSLEEPAARSRADKTIKINETEHMRKQNTILPAVSILAFPDG
jgi:hypothetical protein